MPARKKRILNIVWIVLPAAIALAAICVGRYSLSPRPRTILAFFVGAGLSVAGCCFQSIFSNPLASPDTLGVSSGAAFGAALGILLSLSLLGVQLFALGFGVLAIALTFLLSRLRQDSGVLMVVLAGVISSAFFNALISAAKYLADPLTKLPEITYWLMGSMMGASYNDLKLAVPLIGLPVIVLFLLRWKLNILILPDEEAISLGERPKLLRWCIILLCTAIIAACVSVCGQVGWVGLVIPHLARSIVGSDHRFTLPACISMGGCYLLAIDTIARSLTSGELPLSILTAVIGVPLFVVLFFRKEAGSLAS